MIRTASLVALLALTTIDFACAPPPSDDDTAQVTASILLTAPDVRCLVLKAVGSTTVTSQNEVLGPMSSTLTLGGLPTGSVTFTASAYSVRCSGIGTSAATYVSDPITATVVVGTPLNLSFKMRAASTTGVGNATLDFPEVRGRTDEFPTWSNDYSMPSISAGPDGNLWVVQSYSGVAVVSPQGTTINFFTPINPLNAAPYDQLLSGAFGSDGNFWILATGYVLRMTTSGTVKAFAVPGLWAGRIIAGPDNSMWFLDNGNMRIGKVTPFGAVTFYPIPSPSSFLAAGTDGNLWFAQHSTNKVAKMTPLGVITTYTVPTANALPYGMAAGPDGNIWFTENVGNKIGRVTQSGTFTEFTLPVPTAYPGAITRGADGNLWVACEIGAIAKVTTAGVVTMYPAGSDQGVPGAITAGSDGKIWFTEPPKVGRLTP